MIRNCNWCNLNRSWEGVDCGKPNHGAPHLAETYQAGPSARVMLVRVRQLLKLAADHGAAAPQTASCADLMKLLLNIGVPLPAELQDYEFLPAALTSMPNEILRNIMSFVVALDFDPRPYELFPEHNEFLQKTFEGSIPSIYGPGHAANITPARASTALHEAALSTLLEGDIIRFEMGEIPDWVSDSFPAGVAFLSQIASNSQAGYLKKIRHVCLEFSDEKVLEESRDNFLADTLAAISNISKVCPKLDSLVLRAPWVLELLHEEWYCHGDTPDEHHEIVKEDILRIAAELHTLEIKKITLDLDWWPEYNMVFDDDISFKVDCRADNYETVAMSMYEKFFGPLKSEDGFGGWMERAQVARKLASGIVSGE